MAKPEPTDELAGLHILVAEDNAINQEIVVNLLTDAGAIVDCVENGRLAVERIVDSAERYNVVLMDVQMPELDGLAATRKIREHLSREQLPIIAMTAHAMDEERRRCFEAGMNDHVSKPIDPPQMTATILRWGRGGRLPANIRAAAPPPASTSELGLLLSAFNIGAALARCNDDEAFLRRLFVRFTQQFGTAAGALRQLIGDGDTRAAQILAHTLAGTAGQLGATMLSETSRRLERALRANDGEQVRGLLRDVTIALDAAIESLRALPERDAPAPPVVAPPPLAADIDGALGELALLIAKNQFRAGRAFEATRRAFDATPAEGQATLLAGQLERLDFGSAAQTLRGLIASRKTPPQDDG